MQIVAQIMHVSQWHDHMPLHGRVEVVPATVWPELGQASIYVGFGLVESVKADAMIDQELLQVRKLAQRASSS